MTSQYWILVGSVPSGPFTVVQVHAKLAAGEATWQTPACAVGEEQWRPLLKTPGIGPEATRLEEQLDASPIESKHPNERVHVPRSSESPSKAGSSPEKTPQRRAGTGVALFQVVAVVAAVLLLSILLGAYWQVAVGLTLCLFSAPALFASRARLLALAKYIGTKNHYLARGTCLIGLLVGLSFLGAAVSRFNSLDKRGNLTRGDAEALVRRQLEEKLRGKLDSVQLRDDPGGGFVGEAKQGTAIWDVRVRIQDDGVGWEAEPRETKQEPLPKDPLVKQLAMDMYRAASRGDYGQVVDFIWPNLVEEAGGREQLIKLMEETVSDLKAKGISVPSVEVGEPSEAVQDGPHTFIVIPTRATVKTTRRTLTGRSFVLAISKDGGSSWKFVEGTGLAEQADRESFKPKLPQSLRFPAHEPPRPAKE